MTEEVTTPETPTPQPAVVTAPAVQPAVVTEPATPDLQAAADALLADVPEHLKSLIPQVDPAAQIAWYTKAKTGGAFSTGAPTVPTTDSGKPTVSPVESNPLDLPPMARIASGYGK